MAYSKWAVPLQSLSMISGRPLNFGLFHPRMAWNGGQVSSFCSKWNSYFAKMSLFLAFIPSARGEIRRVDCIMHLSRVMRAGLLCVNKTQLNARQEEEKHWEWWGNTRSLNRRWTSSLPDVANNLKKRLNPAFYWNIFCRDLWLNKGLNYIIWRQNRG